MTVAISLIFFYFSVPVVLLIVFNDVDLSQRLIVRSFDLIWEGYFMLCLPRNYSSSELISPPLLRTFGLLFLGTGTRACSATLTLHTMLTFLAQISCYSVCLIVVRLSRKKVISSLARLLATFTYFFDFFIHNIIIFFVTNIKLCLKSYIHVIARFL